MNKEQIWEIPKLLNTKQAAEYLGINRDTLAVWRCNKTYTLRYVKVGHLVKYRINDLDDFINQRIVGGNENV